MKEVSSYNRRTNNVAGFQCSFTWHQPQAMPLSASAQTKVTLHIYFSQEDKMSVKATLPPTYMLIWKNIKRLYTHI